MGRQALEECSKLGLASAEFKTTSISCMYTHFHTFVPFSTLSYKVVNFEQEGKNLQFDSFIRVQEGQGS